MLPSVAEHVPGFTVVPRTIAGTAGPALITTLALAADVQPVAVSVIVKLCVVEAVRPVIVAVVPVPAIAPGLMVHAPDGKPLKATLPVEVAHVGWVIAPAVGAAGAPGSVSDTGPRIMFDPQEPKVTLMFV